MQTLYLIGNGFDIAHGIKTPYSAFRTFLSENHEDFLVRFEEMYHIQPLDDTEPWYTEEAQQRWEENVIKDLWQYFEEEIGHPDVDGMHSMAESLVEGMPSEGVKDTLDYHWRDQYQFSKLFQKYVLEWLETIDTSGLTYKKESFLKNQSDLFLNFNYTDTLEKIYGIKNVLHIHGGVASCSDIPPIMGHGNKYIIDLYRRKAKKASEDFIEWEQSICTAIADYCEDLYKDTHRIIEQNEVFFSSLQNVEKVICFGLSFGDVDIPYLNRIQNGIAASAKWIAYYFDSEAKNRLKNVFGIIGISNKFEHYFLQSGSFWET